LRLSRTFPKEEGMADTVTAGTSPSGPTATEAPLPSRRGFLSWLAVAWLALAAGVGAFVTTMARFLFPNVLFEPPSSFKAGFPADYQVGEVDERWKERYQIWIVRNTEMLYALITVCTHLGCIPNWLAAQNKFKCPCHGSGYYRSGINFEGPTPRPLERAAISISPDDGQIFIDKARKFLYEKGQWTDPAAFIKTT
jgi:cytochrome b6-f complex iron-sulfur subunit